MNYQIIYSTCSQAIKPRRRKNIMQKLLKNHITKLRFGIIGAINTILDIGILFALSGIFSIPKVPANIISTTVTFVISFFANRKYTFKPASSQHIVREMILFTGITLFGLWVIQGIIINVLTAILHESQYNRRTCAIIRQAYCYWRFDGMELHII